MPEPITAEQLRDALTRNLRQLLADINPAEPPVGLPPSQLAILRVLTHSPRSRKTLARLARRPDNSHFRAALRLLVDSGRARHTSQGYSLP